MITRWGQFSLAVDLIIVAPEENDDCCSRTNVRLAAIVCNVRCRSVLLFLDWLSAGTLGWRLVLAAWLSLGWIGDPGSANFCKGSERMHLTSRQTHDVFHGKSVNQQGIGNKRSVASPRHGFGAHQDNLLV